jgi:hypothetical protein
MTPTGVIFTPDLTTPYEVSHMRRTFFSVTPSGVDVTLKVTPNA